MASAAKFNIFFSGIIQKDGICEAFTQVDSVVKNETGRPFNFFSGMIKKDGICAHLLKWILSSKMTPRH